MRRLIIYIILLTLAIWFTSCRTQYIPVETVRTEIQYKERADSTVIKEKVNVRDSVSIRDSIVYVLNDKGEVIRKEVYKWQDRFRDCNSMLEKLQSKYDSLYLAKQDSIQVPFSVEKELSRWQSMKLELGGWAFGIIILFVLLIVSWLVYRLRKK